MNIVFLDAKTLGNQDTYSIFNPLGSYKAYDHTPEDDIIHRSLEADIVITNKVPFSEETITQLPNLKYICIAATGMDHVDLEAAEKAGVNVTNAKGYSTESVAQHTFALLLSLLHQLSYHHNFIENGQYSKHSLFTHFKPFFELKGKIFGIIGMGTIGKRVAELASSFGCKVQYFSPSGVLKDLPYEQVDLPSLAENSQIISLHTALTPQTQQIIGKDLINRFQQKPIIVNTARGALIDTDALIEGLKSQQIAGAAIDVFDQEPLPRTSRLLKNQVEKGKLLLTPHMAWASIESRTALLHLLRDQIRNCTF